MKNKDIDAINAWLDEVYGHDLLGRANYRIIWSVGELEKRKGTFQIFSGPIFLREYYGVMELPKYKYHPDWRERWVLERLDFGHNPELALDQPGHYEPLYVFYDRNGDYQKPTMKALKYYMYLLTKPKPKFTDKEWQKRWDEQADQDMKEETEFFYGCLEDEFGGSMATALHQREAIVVPGVIHKPDGGLHWFDKGKGSKKNESIDSSKRSPVHDPVQEVGSATV